MTRLGWNAMSASLSILRGRLAEFACQETDELAQNRQC